MYSINCIPKIIFEQNQLTLSAPALLLQPAERGIRIETGPSGSEGHIGAPVRPLLLVVGHADEVGGEGGVAEVHLAVGGLGAPQVVAALAVVAGAGNLALDAVVGVLLMRKIFRTNLHA